MKKLSSKLYSKFDKTKSIELDKIMGGRASDTGTCPTDYTTSGGNPDCTTEECTDVICTDSTFDTPVRG